MTDIYIINDSTNNMVPWMYWLISHAPGNICTRRVMKGSRQIFAEACSSIFTIQIRRVSFPEQDRKGKRANV